MSEKMRRYVEAQFKQKCRASLETVAQSMIWTFLRVTPFL